MSSTQLPRNACASGAFIVLAFALLAACHPASSGPIEAPEDQWTWVPFSDSRCMNGEATGIGIRTNSASEALLVFLEGGGACFNALSCSQLVANIGGYGEEEFSNDVSALQARAMFDRSDPANPFRDWNQVYVPYCSGDVHAGDAAQGAAGRIQEGYRNLGLFLERLVATYADASRVVLAGSSAGGFGALINFDRVQQAFGDVPVTLLDDSGPPLSPTWIRPCLQEQWRASWNLDATFPSDCAGCRDPALGIAAIAPFLAQKYPDSRFAVLSSTQDLVLRAFFSFGYSADCQSLSEMPPGDFEAGLNALRSSVPSDSNFRFFTTSSDEHVLLDDGELETTVAGGVPLSDWLRALVDGTPDWANASD